MRLKQGTELNIEQEHTSPVGLTPFMGLAFGSFREIESRGR
jgi:hypothetical protein